MGESFKKVQQYCQCCGHNTGESNANKKSK